MFDYSLPWPHGHPWNYYRVPAASASFILLFVSISMRCAQELGLGTHVVPRFPHLTLETPSIFGNAAEVGHRIFLPPRPFHNLRHPWRCCTLPRSYSARLCRGHSGPGVTTPRLHCAWHRCSTREDPITLEGSGGIACTAMGGESCVAAWGGWMMAWMFRRGVEDVFVGSW